MKNGSSAKRTEFSAGISIPSFSSEGEKTIQVHFERAQKVYSDSIKPGKAKIYCSGDTFLIVNYHKDGKLRWALLGKSGEIKEVGEL